jgi:hypothetical protein
MFLISCYFDRLNYYNKEEESFIIFVHGNYSYENFTERHYVLSNGVLEIDGNIKLSFCDATPECEENCESINFFNKSNMAWKYELKFHERYKNYHGCHVYVQADEFYAVPNVLSLPYEVAKMVGKRLNFTVIELNQKQRTINGNFEFDDYEPYNYLILLWKWLIDIEDASYTTPFDTEELIYLVTPSRLYTNYEKLYLPFDYATWKFLFITFSCAFSIIFIVNSFSQRIKDIIIGENVQTPAFNVVSIFFGIGQVKLPTGNFARIILTTFIYFCLVIRTAYQGVQFELITNDVHKPSPKTYDEIFKFNYSFNLLVENNLGNDYEICSQLLYNSLDNSTR